MSSAFLTPEPPIFSPFLIFPVPWPTSSLFAMKPAYTTLLLLLAPIAACSGETTPVFDDPVTALEQAEAAQASGDLGIAEAGYRYASEHGSADIKPSALLGLCLIQANQGEENAAHATFEALEASSKLTQIQYAKIIQAAHDARLSDFGESLIEGAVAAHPEMYKDLEAFDAAFVGFRTGVESDLNMAEIGYVDD
ncbi:MAG: hypothetical protein ACPG31_01475 [Planctomycetota bacterium]